MILKEIMNILDAKMIYKSNPNILNKEFYEAFASDLMSDALALIQDDNDSTLLITGLANPQALRTAEMLDLSVIIYVRDKIPAQDQIDMAKSLGITLISVKDTMFMTCGKLYEAGLGT